VKITYCNDCGGNCHIIDVSMQAASSTGIMVGPDLLADIDTSGWEVGERFRVSIGPHAITPLDSTSPRSPIPANT
jgi:hypothetical protein